MGKKRDDAYRKALTKFPLVEVEWLDSAFTSGWKSHTTYSTPERCRTSGYLTYKTRKVINISMQVSPESRGETMAIPRGNVRSIRKLR